MTEYIRWCTVRLVANQKVMLSLSTQQLSVLDEFAKEKGLNRSAAVAMAVQIAQSAPSRTDVRKWAAEKFLEMDQHRLGVQEIQVDDSGELVKRSEAEVEANRLRFEAELAKNRALARGAVVAPPDLRRYGGQSNRMDQTSEYNPEDESQDPKDYKR